MKVKFLRPYRGRETGEEYVNEGEVLEIDDGEVEHLVNEEVIERPKAEELPLLKLTVSPTSGKDPQHGKANAKKR